MLHFGKQLFPGDDGLPLHRVPVGVSQYSLHRLHLQSRNEKEGFSDTSMRWYGSEGQVQKADKHEGGQHGIFMNTAVRVGNTYIFGA